MARVNAGLAAGLSYEQALAAVTVALVDATSAAEIDFVAGIWQAKQTAVAAVTPAATAAAGTSSDAVAQYTKTADAIGTETVRLAAGYQETFKQAIAEAHRDYEILVAKIDGEQAIDAANEEHLTTLILNPEVNAEGRATVDAVRPLHLESTTILGWLSDAFATGTFQTKVQHALIDLSAGVIDVLTGNATQHLREALGVDWLVDQSSWAYTAGQAAGIGISFAAGFFTGGAGWVLLGVEAAGGLFDCSATFMSASTIRAESTARIHGSTPGTC